jgi:uncharacterized OsmC-like protein
MSIADSVTSARAYLTEHPDEARYRDARATARVAAGLVAEVSGPGGESLRTDMPSGIGGTATAPSPGWYLRAAAASCLAALIAIRAAATGESVGAVEVAVDSESDDRGILGLADDIPAGALSMHVVVTIDRVRPEVARSLADWALRHCPVTDTIVRPVPVTLEVR